MRATRRVRAGLMASVAVGASWFAATPASAYSYFKVQTWGPGSYHASTDFVPPTGTIYIGGRGNSGGAARYWYSQLVKTSGSAGVFSTYSYPADNRDYIDNRGVSVNTGTSYYLRWYGQLRDGQNGYSAPASSAIAAR